MPVLMVTALDSSTRKIAGLNAGADDYITKPFELEELLTRARVLLRRAQTPMLQVLEWGDLQLDPNTREVAYGSQTLSLTPKEYRLLELFLRKQSQVFSRGAILDSLWNCGEAPGEDTVTAHIKGLRRKLTEAGAPADLIKTVYGVGYRLKPQESSSGTSSPSTEGHQQSAPPKKQIPSPKAFASGNDHREQTRAALQSLWHTTRSQQEERLATIKQAVIATATGQLTPDLHQQAQRAAHSLKGALGVFGLAAGSELAQLIEQALANHSSPIHYPQLQCWVLALQQELIKGPALPEPETPQPTLPLLGGNRRRLRPGRPAGEHRPGSRAHCRNPPHQEPFAALSSADFHAVSNLAQRFRRRDGHAPTLPARSGTVQLSPAAGRRRESACHRRPDSPDTAPAGAGVQCRRQFRQSHQSRPAGAIHLFCIIQRCRRFSAVGCCCDRAPAPPSPPKS